MMMPMKLLPLVLAGIAVSTAAAAPGARPRRATCGDSKYKELCEEESPPELECVWAPVNLGDFEEADFSCQAPTCENMGAGDQQGGDPQARCKADAKCSWNDQAYVCVTTGNAVPCELFYADPANGEECPSGCVYNADIEKCAKAGATIKCDEVYDSDKCGTFNSGGCEWNEKVFKCWEKGKPLPCIEYEYFSQDDCPATCKWEQLGAGSEASEEGRCLEKDENIACEEMYEADGCAALSAGRCEWHAKPMEICWPKGMAIPCRRFDGQACSASDQCTWTTSAAAGSYQEAGACGDCATPGAACVQEWSGGGYDGGGGYGGDEYGGKDTGKACTTYDGETCPRPRCFVDFDQNEAGNDQGCGGDSGGKCRDPTCIDLEYDAGKCTSLPATPPDLGCAYDDASGACYPKDGSDFPCKNFYDEANCGGEDAGKYCEWTKTGQAGGGEYEANKGVCHKKGSPIACDMMDAFDKEHCENGPQAVKCVWHEDIYECKAPGYEPPCSAVDASNCPAERCELQQGVCWDKGKELPCSALCSAFHCGATGKCTWSQESYTCSDCPATGCPKANTDACETFTTETTCPSSRCEFMFYEENGVDTSGACTNKVCTEKYEKEECEAVPKAGLKACVWTASTEYANQGTCFPTGFTSPCNLQYDSGKCTAAGCDWDAPNYHCNEKGLPTPCTLYQVESCPADRCTPGEYECLHKAFPQDVPDWATIAKHGTGTGNQDENKCTTAMYEQLKGALEEADSECMVVGRRERKDAHRAGRATEQQVECLSYFLKQATPASSITAACPCLWAWASEIEVYEDHWMELTC